MENKYLNMKQARLALGVSFPTLKGLVDSGKIRCLTVGNVRFIPESELGRFEILDKHSYKVKLKEGEL